MSPACPACLAPGMRERRISPRLVLFRCESCGHRIGAHLSGPDAPAGQDIHCQYEQGEFLDALRATRQRQARLALRLIARHEPHPGALLDYGSGRGWFIEAAAAAGYRELAGADISELALDWLRERGAAAVRLELGAADPGAAFGDLPFRPRIVSFLDVVEHFTPVELEPSLKSLTQALSPELRWILIKVPSSGGLLYRIASLLAAAGFPRALERLWQVGSLTPHHHYFSAASAEALLRRMGWSLVERLGDPDFEPESLLTRARLLDSLPGWLRRWAGALTTTAISVLRLHDTQLFLISVR